MMKIDLDRDILYEVPVDRRPPGGVVIKRDNETGADVFMYRTSPGVYYSANGLEVSATMAKRAGFDIVRLAQEREKNQKMKDFEAKWNRDMQVSVREVVKERNGFRLVNLGGSRYIIEDMEGMCMTPGKQASTLKMGEDWFTDFAGPEEVKDDDVHEPDGQSVAGADRRSTEDGRPAGNVRQPSNKKATVSA